MDSTSVAAYYINLDAREDRRAHMQQTQLPLFAKCLGGLQVQRLSATHTRGNGALGCALSHTRALAAGLATHRPWLLVLEDDFQWELPHAYIVRFFDWLACNTTEFDVLCLSYYLPKTELIMAGSAPQLMTRAQNMQTTCGYIVTREFARAHLLPCFESAVAQMQAGATLHTAAIDVAWKPLQTQYKFMATTPRLARQVPGVSNIIVAPKTAGVEIDYGGNFAVLVVHGGASSKSKHTQLPFLTRYYDCGNTGSNIADAVRTLRAECPLLQRVLVVINTDYKDNQKIPKFNTAKIFDCLKMLVSPRRRPHALVYNTEVYGNRVFVASPVLLDAWLQSTQSTQHSIVYSMEDVLPQLRRLVAVAAAHGTQADNLSADILCFSAQHTNHTTHNTTVSTAGAAGESASRCLSPTTQDPCRRTARPSGSPSHDPAPRVELGPWSAVVAAASQSVQPVRPAWVETSAGI